MAKRVFRFSADLRALKPTPELGSRIREEARVNEETLRELALDAELGSIAPAALPPVEWSDPLSAEEFLSAYNASLRRAQSVGLGRYSQNGIDYHVFFDSHGHKNVVTQPQEQPGYRLSHLIASSDGGLLRLSLETSARGEVLDLGYLMKMGIAELPDEELYALPDYWLLKTCYHREGPYLLRVEQSRRHYNAVSDAVLEFDDVSLG